jgi:subtilase family serine protease
VLDLAARYNINPLYQQGIMGHGRTIGIVTLASFTPSDAFAYWSSLNLNVDPNRLTVVNIDGGPGAPSDASDSGETTVDVEQSGGLAPDARIIVYQAPNTLYQLLTAGVQTSQPGQTWSEVDTTPAQTLFVFPAHFRGRNLPDVSLNADPLTGYIVFYTSDVTGFAVLHSIGGTSFVGPQLAGITALLAQNAGHRLGLLNPLLYGLAALGGTEGPGAVLNTISTGATGSIRDATVTAPRPAPARSTWRTWPQRSSSLSRPHCSLRRARTERLRRAARAGLLGRWRRKRKVEAAARPASLPMQQSPGQCAGVFV